MTQTSKTTGLIRMALMGAAFIVLTVVLIVFQPGSPRTAQVLPDLETSVTRSAAPLNAIEPVSEPAARNTTASRPSTTVVNNSADQPTNIRDLTFSAISSLKSVTTGEAPFPGQPGSLLHSVVQRSMAAGPPPQLRDIETVRADVPRAPSAGSYFVRPGDTLRSIAQELYGNAALSTEIFEANIGLLSRPDDIQPGMVLKLPTR
ncbi:LysM peptidoglycan-binding domain-containing protein [Marivita sp.]|uniref:LysM peptidoglycan-binding domain-containing protein n=1 Tax=Marivita sp. TaxID=2003365 RepID=UPI0025C49F47|nr:LysM peptidoglycan-binding domain-containing protein [Marivita sp.]